MASELKLANSFWGLSTQDRSLTWSTTSSSEEEEEELSLCLSLGGIYSRPAQDKPSLLRSSSSSLAGLRRRGASPELSLSRSCSLPTDPDAADTSRRRRSPPSAAKIGRIKNQDCLKFQGDSRQPMEPRGGTGWPADSELGGRKKASWAEVTRRMPSVTTTGDGPHGRRIEGFLYKYTKGHVSIVCVCHGSFLTPAEFVRHAGGTEVENPMRRINVLTL